MKLPNSRQCRQVREEGIRKGLYKFETAEGKVKGHVQLLSSGVQLCHVRAAAQILANDYGITAEMYSQHHHSMN